MTETNNGTSAPVNGVAPPAKIPGIVIFAAILQFFSVAFFGFLSLGCLAAIGLGSVMGMGDYFMQQASRFSAANSSAGLTLFFAVGLAVLLCFTGFFLSLAIGLLKGKKFAWYFQIAFSTLSMLGLPLGVLWAVPFLPLGSLLNILILILFFRPRVRGYFKV